MTLLWDVLVSIVGFYVIIYVHMTIWNIAYRRGFRAGQEKMKASPSASISPSASASPSEGPEEILGVKP